MANPFVHVELNTTDLDQAKKFYEALGATILKGITEVKDMGSFSIIVDPTGAMLGLRMTKH